MTADEFWQVPEYVEMRGEVCPEKGSPEKMVDHYPSVRSLALTGSLKGKLIVEWPSPEISWWRRAHRNVVPVLAVLENRAPEPQMTGRK